MALKHRADMLLSPGAAHAVLDRHATKKLYMGTPL